jgi:hypothetical protein
MVRERFIATVYEPARIWVCDFFQISLVIAVDDPFLVIPFA